MVFPDFIRFESSARGPGGLGRREFLRIGGLSSLGLAQLASARVAEALEDRGVTPRARSVIVVFANGGQSQLEMWDPKPDAPEVVRGEFGSIQSSVPGILLGEHMPRLAAIADRYTILRAVSHDDLDHGSAVYQALTGRPHTRKSSNPPPSPNDYPTLGSLLKRVRPEAASFETSVHLNGPSLVPFEAGPGQDGGVLGRAFDPMVVGDPTIGEYAGLPRAFLPPPVRVDRRMGLLRSLEAYRADLAEQRQPAALDAWRLRALEFLENPRGLEAFDLSSESDSTRDRYGRNRSGQSCLLARRLVEAGVPWVNVFWNHTGRGQDRSPDITDEYGWDTHNDIFVAMRERLLPRFDQGFSALLEDLDARGLLESTLVVCMGEFGRAPKVALEPTFAGASPGRKHWASVYSIVMAGAGARRGATFGRSDRHAAYPEEERVAPWDVAATLFWALGLDPGRVYHDALGRPLALTLGQPITGVFS